MVEPPLRRTLLLAAFVGLVVVVVVELGAPHLVGGGTVDAAAGVVAVTDQSAAGSLDSAKEPPGRGISYLALVDVALLFVVGQYVLAQLAPGRLHGRVTGVATFVGSVVLLVVGAVLLVIAVVEVVVMISLFVAAPFGTIAYLAVWGGFPRDGAAALLTALVTLQVLVTILLVLAQPKLLRQRGLVVLTLVSLVLKLVVGFLHAVVPRPVAAITDDVGAIVVAVCALVVAVVFLVVSVPAIVKVLRVDRLASTTPS